MLRTIPSILFIMINSLKYRLFEEERSILWEVIVSVILSRKVYMHVCLIPNGYRDIAISLYRRATRHVLTRVAKSIDVNGGIFEKYIILGKLCQLCHLDNKYRY
jgi:hypothetical protein